MKKLFFAVVLISMGASAQVPSTYFGMDFNSSNTAWPVINQAPIPKWNGGVIRMHDSGTKLYDIFNGATTGGTCDPRASTPVVSGCNWAALDKFAANALANNAVLEYTFSKMPTSAYWSDCFTYTSYFSGTTTCDAAFVSMVKAIRDRVGCKPTKTIGCVAQWEIWNEPNNNTTNSGANPPSTTNGGTPYWTGTGSGAGPFNGAGNGNMALLVHLARLIHDHVKTTAKGGVDGIDANALVLGPGDAVQSSNITITTNSTCTASFGNGNLNLEAHICLFLSTAGSGSGDLTGKSYVDVITAHFYPSSQTLSTMAEQPYTSRAAGVQTALTLNTITQCGIGISPLSGGCKGLVNSEWSWGTCSSPTTPRLGPTGCSVQSSGTGQTGSWRDDQSALLVKSYHLGVKYGMMGQYWYGWEFMNGYGNLYCTGTNSTIGCAADSTHTIPGQQSAAWAWGAVQWIVGKTLTGCTQTSSTWRCDYTGANGYKASVVWNSAGTGSSTTFTGITQTQDMYGNVTDQPTGSVTLTPNYYPVTVETIPATGSTTPPILLTDSYANSHYEAKGTTSNAASAYVQKTANGTDFDDPVATLTNLGGLGSNAGYTFRVVSGTTYAHNNLTGVDDYSGTDAAAVIRSVITANSSVCGRLFFRNGIYNFDSFVQETTTGFTTNYYAVGFPGTATTTTTCEWMVEGESSPTFVYPGGTGSPVPTVPTNGVVFNVTTTATSSVSGTNMVHAFWSRPVTNTAFAGQAAWVNYKHLGVRFPTNQRGYTTHIDCTNSNVCNFDGVITDYNIAFDSLTPAVANSYGIVTTGGSEAGGQIIQTYSIGDYVGFDIRGEHAMLWNSIPIKAVYGIDWGVRAAPGNNASVYHGATWIHSGWALCQHGLTIGTYIQQGDSVDMTNLLLEEATSGFAPSFQPIYRIKETNDGYVSGRISFYRVLAGVGTSSLAITSLFDGGGGSKFEKQTNGKTLVNDFEIAGTCTGCGTSGTFVNYNTGTRPTCDASHRGNLWTVQGSTGVADSTTQCQKDSSDAYSWTAIGSGGGGSGTVTSVTFTGDGTVLSSTPSSAVTTSGTVTATAATAAAHKVLGNFTGSTATPTYGTITSGEVNNTIALTGTDINTSNQVTATHLASALPIAQGGTASTTAAAALTALGGVAYSTASQPTCDSSHEGWIYYVKASGATAGYLQLCLGTGSSAFAWTTK